MRADCHLHTARHSACSHLHPQRACALARERGLDVLVFTEHHRRWPPRDLQALTSLHPGLALFSGMEVTLAEGYDVVLLGTAVPEALPPFLPLRSLKRQLTPRRQDIFACVAHPFRYVGHVTPALEAVLDWVDGLEAFSCTILEAGFHFHQDQTVVPASLELAQECARRHGLRLLANSDGHSETAVGTFANLLPDPVAQDVAQLVHALKAQPPEPWQDPRQLAAFLASPGAC